MFDLRVYFRGRRWRKRSNSYFLIHAPFQRVVVLTRDQKWRMYMNAGLHTRLKINSGVTGYRSIVTW